MPTICLADTWAAEKAAVAALLVAVSWVVANTVVDTWTAEKIVVVATADHAALMKAHPAADADGVECLATAHPAIPLSESG